MAVLLASLVRKREQAQLSPSVGAAAVASPPGGKGISLKAVLHP
jgi:hypothetical protein